MTDQISLSDVGTDLQVTITEDGVAVDVSAATVLEIQLIKPNGTVVTKTAIVLNTGVDGIIHYVTIAGDIDQIGDWSYRGIVTFSATQKFHSIVPKIFTVKNP